MSRRGFTLVELLIVVAIIGILAAIAVPNFLRFQGRSKQSEAKANLKSLFTAQLAYYNEHSRFETNLSQVGFQIERGNRYAVGIDITGPSVDRSGPNEIRPAGFTSIEVDTFKFTTTRIPSPPRPPVLSFSPPAGSPSPPAVPPGGLSGTCPVCEFSAYASGNIDSEPTGIDLWVISSTGGDCTPVDEPALRFARGAPFNGYNDVALDL